MIRIRLGTLLALVACQPMLLLAAPPTRTDVHGDPLPPEVISRLGTTRFRHGDNVFAIAFSPDGTRLVSADWYGAHLWDAASGREIRRLGPRFNTSLHSLSLSPDGKIVALAEHQTGVIQILDVATGKLLHQFLNGLDNSDRFCALMFSPDGKVLASYAGKLIRLWDTATGKQLRKWEGDPEGVHRIVFTPDGKTLISGGEDRTIRFWDTSTGKEARRISDHPGPTAGLALSPDGKMLASLGSTRHEWKGAGGISSSWLQNDNKVHLWDAATGKKIRHLETVGAAPKIEGRPGYNPNAIHQILFAPDGKTLVTVGQDRTLRIWDAETAKELRRWQLLWVTSLAFSPDGKILATSGIDCMVRLWNPATGRELLEQAGHHAGVQFLSLSPDGRRVASASADRTVRIWDAASGRELHRLRSPKGGMAPVAFSADGRTMKTAGIAMTSEGGDKRGRIWDTASGKELRQLPDWTACSTFAVSADGRTYALVEEEKRILLWDAVAERKLATRIDPPKGISQLAFSLDGRVLFGWCGDRKMHVWDIATGKELRQFAIGDGGDYNHIAFSPDGRWIAWTGRDQEIRLYDPATGEVVRRIYAPSHFNLCLAFAPDGRTLASANMYDPTIHLWETASGQRRHRLTGHQGRIFTLLFSTDSKCLLSGSRDTTALLWDVIGDRERKAALAPAELRACWDELASENGETAYRAIRTLAAAAESAVDFLRKQLHPIPAPDPKRVARLIADLDHDGFAQREKATKELERLGEAVELDLRAARAEAASLEMRLRLEALLAKLADEQRRTALAVRLRIPRAIEVLERIGTAEARKVLRTLADGATGARRTHVAKTALERLTRHD